MSYNPNEAELAYIRKTHEECAAFLTICGGFLAPQLAGILAGKTATAPRFMLPELKKQDPRTQWVDKRFARDGKVWTSGALLNGLDLMREFMLEYWPELTANAISLGGIPVRDVEYVGQDGY
jgi:transcriptional regulator GlxA family with amidase domain